MDTPEPLPRQSAPVVSFLPVDTRHHATADISVVGPSGKTPCPQQHWQQIMGVLQWRNPAVSALLFLIGTFLALAGEFVLRGDHSVTPLKGVPQTDHSPCPALSVLGATVAEYQLTTEGMVRSPTRVSAQWRLRPCSNSSASHLIEQPMLWGAAVSVLCLADLALNFLRSMVSSSWQERAAWATSDFTRNTAEGAKQVPVTPRHSTLIMQPRLLLVWSFQQHKCNMVCRRCISWLSGMMFSCRRATLCSPFELQPPSQRLPS